MPELAQPQNIELTPQQIGAVNVLIKGVQVAHSKGAYTLRDASKLQEALDVLVPPTEQLATEQEQESSEA